MYWIGETFNLMSLGGLAVAIGLIIDDTVVVIENIARHLTGKGTGNREQGTGNREQGSLSAPASPVPCSLFPVPSSPDPIDAASGEITGAVVGSTLTTVLVFVPLAFISGVYGQFFASLSWSLSIAVLVSMVISLTLVPVVAAKFLAGRPMPAPGRIYTTLADMYEWVLSHALRVPRITLAMSVAAIGLGVLLCTGIPHVFNGVETGLLPAMDEGALILDYWAPAGTPLERTEELAKDLERILLRNPDVASYLRRTGTENGMFATQTNRGDLQVILRPAQDDPWSILTKPVRPKFKDIKSEYIPLGEKLAAARYGPNYTEVQKWQEAKRAFNPKYRRRALSQIKDELEDAIKDKYHEHQLKCEIIQIMQDELNDLSGASKPIEVKLFGEDYFTLQKLATKVGDRLANNDEAYQKVRRIRGLKEIDTTVTAGNPDLKIEVNTAKAARLNIKVDEVERQTAGDLLRTICHASAGNGSPHYQRARSLSGSFPLRRGRVPSRRRAAAIDPFAGLGDRDQRHRARAAVTGCAGVHAGPGKTRSQPR